MLDLIAALIVSLAGQEAAGQAVADHPAPISTLQRRVPLTGPGTPPDGSVEMQPGAEAFGIFSQAFAHWRLRCDDPDFVRERIQVDVTLDSEGRIVAGPTVIRPRDNTYWRATAETARIALIAASPFEVPDDYAGGRYRPIFNPARACAAD
ncbi:hypothetical protein N0B44_33640 [Roseibacterium beibuensis]|uniref:hypothetical protein n=1 Tax=[Roseibacterium] beibuensis TaxID=1193142 RepID=UPI00217EDD75|nr:hypothetical protein [Roseibacterium beibuensis]MCS6627856.1 hypothetical protein [Roseibacterium beibuensis]